MPTARAPRALAALAPFALLALLALPLALPLAQAHYDNPLPGIQGRHDPRVATIALNGTRADVDLLLRADPPRHFLRYTLDPAQGVFQGEYRPTASTTEDAFWWQVALTRVVEYRDVNSDLQFDPAIDAVVRQWPLRDGSWSVGRVLDARVDNVNVKTLQWEARLGSGPLVKLQAAAGGSSAFQDEGALALPQDVVLYLDLQELPPRGTGHLFALDGEVRVRKDTQVRPHRYDAENVTTAVLASSPGRLAHFQWGGEAVIDGKEQRVEGTMSEPSETEEGLLVHTLRLSPPIMDERGRLVIVFGMEYVMENKRAPGFDAALLLAPVALVALALRRRLRRDQAVRG